MTARNGTKVMKDELWARGHRNCAYCGRQLRKKRGYPDSRSLDHKLPLSRGGFDGPGNVVLACHECNMAKGEKTVAEYMRTLAPRIPPPPEHQAVGGE